MAYPQIPNNVNFTMPPPTMPPPTMPTQNTPTQMTAQYASQYTPPTNNITQHRGLTDLGNELDTHEMPRNYVLTL